MFRFQGKGVRFQENGLGSQVRRTFFVYSGLMTDYVEIESVFSYPNVSLATD